MHSAPELDQPLQHSTTPELPAKAWRDLAAEWRVWLGLFLSLLIGTLAWVLGYD